MSEPLVVYGRASLLHDFGPQHPLTPLRFGPAIGLLRSVGAERFMEPPQATDAEILRLHTADFVRAVQAFSEDPWLPPAAGIGSGDTPAFAGMHEAAAIVAGGSLAAVEQILAGDVEHAFHPGGGLHHAMAGRAGGFCVYNDVALAVARARDAGHRVLYVDLDVHHGDGTQALFWDDPEVVTLSIHESGLSLFPGTGFVEERGGTEAHGTAVNVPLQAFSGDSSWQAALTSVLPALAELFRPTFLVSQHGCDSHALDPLANLRLTTRSYVVATELLDQLAHRFAEGRWLATGGGGYDAYRVVPRSWALVWLAQAHLPVPLETEPAWRDEWAAAAERYGQAPPPVHFLDPVGMVGPEPPQLGAVNRRTAELALVAARARLGAQPTDG